MNTVLIAVSNVYSYLNKTTNILSRVTRGNTTLLKKYFLFLYAAYVCKLIFKPELEVKNEPKKKSKIDEII